jgi:Myb-like DNA-binding domain
MDIRDILVPREETETEKHRGAPPTPPLSNRSYSSKVPSSPYNQIHTTLPPLSVLVSGPVNTVSYSQLPVAPRFHPGPSTTQFYPDEQPPSQTAPIQYYAHPANQVPIHYSPPLTHQSSRLVYGRYSTAPAHSHHSISPAVHYSHTHPVVPASISTIPTSYHLDTHTSEPQPKKIDRRIPWSREEDKLLIKLRREGNTWEAVSKALPGRSATGCSLRYREYGERKSNWNGDKENQLIWLYEKYDLIYYPVL